jgi:hypothetical protein
MTLLGYSSLVLDMDTSFYGVFNFITSVIDPNMVSPCPQAHVTPRLSFPSCSAELFVEDFSGELNDVPCLRPAWDVVCKTGLLPLLFKTLSNIPKVWR